MPAAWGITNIWCFFSTASQGAVEKTLSSPGAVCPSISGKWLHQWMTQIHTSSFRPLLGAWHPPIVGLTGHSFSSASSGVSRHLLCGRQCGVRHPDSPLFSLGDKGVQGTRAGRERAGCGSLGESPPPREEVTSKPGPDGEERPAAGSQAAETREVWQGPRSSQMPGGDRNDGICEEPVVVVRAGASIVLQALSNPSLSCPLCLCSHTTPPPSGSPRAAACTSACCPSVSSFLKPNKPPRLFSRASQRPSTSPSPPSFAEVAVTVPVLTFLPLPVPPGPLASLFPCSLVHGVSRVFS